MCVSCRACRFSNIYFKPKTLANTMCVLKAFGTCCVWRFFFISSHISLYVFYFALARLQPIVSDPNYCSPMALFRSFFSYSRLLSFSLYSVSLYRALFAVQSFSIYHLCLEFIFPVFRLYWILFSFSAKQSMCMLVPFLSFFCCCFAFSCLYTCSRVFQ